MQVTLVTLEPRKLAVLRSTAGALVTLTPLKCPFGDDYSRHMVHGKTFFSVIATCLLNMKIYYKTPWMGHDPNKTFLNIGQYHVIFHYFSFSIFFCSHSCKTHLGGVLTQIRPI